jgi:hypothetical protein
MATDRRALAVVKRLLGIETVTAAAADDDHDHAVH